MDPLKAQSGPVHHQALFGQSLAGRRWFPGETGAGRRYLSSGQIIVLGDRLHGPGRCRGASQPADPPTALRPLWKMLISVSAGRRWPGATGQAVLSRQKRSSCSGNPSLRRAPQSPQSLTCATGTISMRLCGRTGTQSGVSASGAGGGQTHLYHFIHGATHAGKPELMDILIVDDEPLWRTPKCPVVEQLDWLVLRPSAMAKKRGADPVAPPN